MHRIFALQYRWCVPSSVCSASLRSHLPPGEGFGSAHICGFPQAFPSYKKILPSRVLGREQFLASWCHPNSEIPLESPSLAQKSGLRGPAISVRCTLYACSADVLPGAAAKAFQQSGFLSGQLRIPVLLPRRRRSSDRSFVFHHDTPIQIAALQSEDQHFGRGQIGRAGDVIRITQAECAHDALILPRVGVIRV